MFSLKDKKILLTGGHGFLGEKVYQELLEAGARAGNIYRPRKKELDLLAPANCKKAVRGRDLVIHLAANVGGIGYNHEHPAKLFYENAVMGIHLIEEARLAKTKKFVQVGTVCAYPKFTPVPFREENLWDGYPEETNAPYGLAKKMLLIQLQSYRREYGLNGIYLLPVNLYGPGDNFDPNSSHVIPALIKKFVDAKKRHRSKVEVWGTGKPSREFLYVDDAARGILLATLKYDRPEPVNLGSGREISIKDLANLLAGLTGFTGKIAWDKTKPDGQPKRRLDVGKAKKYFGFQAKTDFKIGLEKTVDWYIQMARN